MRGSEVCFTMWLPLVGYCSWLWKWRGGGEKIKCLSWLVVFGHFAGRFLKKKQFKDGKYTMTRAGFSFHSFQLAEPTSNPQFSNHGATRRFHKASAPAAWSARMPAPPEPSPCLSRKIPCVCLFSFYSLSLVSPKEILYKSPFTVISCVSPKFWLIF